MNPKIGGRRRCKRLSRREYRLQSGADASSGFFLPDHDQAGDKVDAVGGAGGGDAEREHDFAGFQFEPAGARRNGVLDTVFGPSSGIEQSGKRGEDFFVLGISGHFGGGVGIGVGAFVGDRFEDLIDFGKGFDAGLGQEERIVGEIEVGEVLTNSREERVVGHVLDVLLVHPAAFFEVEVGVTSIN